MCVVDGCALDDVATVEDTRPGQAPPLPLKHLTVERLLRRLDPFEGLADTILKVEQVTRDGGDVSTHGRLASLVCLQTACALPSSRSTAAIPEAAAPSTRPRAGNSSQRQRTQLPHTLFDSFNELPVARRVLRKNRSPPGDRMKHRGTSGSEQAFSRPFGPLQQGRIIRSRASGSRSPPIITSSSTRPSGARPLKMELENKTPRMGSSGGMGESEQHRSPKPSRGCSTASVGYPSATEAIGTCRMD